MPLAVGSRARMIGVLFLVLTLDDRLLAQPAAPPPPNEYRVQIRYRIRTAGSGRLAQYKALIRYLESIGFHKDPGPENEAEDPDQTRMTGTIASSNARRSWSIRMFRRSCSLRWAMNYPPKGTKPSKSN